MIEDLVRIWPLVLALVAVIALVGKDRRADKRERQEDNDLV